MKRLSTLMLVAILGLPALQAASPLCGSELVLVGYQAAWNELVVDIDNPTPAPQTGGIVLDFVMDGQGFQWWFGGIEVPAQTGWQVTMEFPSTLTVIGVTVCKDRPTGIVDAPEPVASRTKQEERKKKK